MAAARILLIDSDSEPSRLAREFLRSNGFEVDLESQGDRAVERIRQANPDLVILEVVLPILDGFEVCRRSRFFYKNPILILTARSEESDQMAGLALGADDYLTKPVSPPLLLARIKTLLRRSQNNGSKPRRIQTDSVVIDAARRSVQLEGSPIDLTTMEFDLLWALVSRAGEAVSRDEINSGLRGTQWDGLNRSVDLSISRLRKKLGENGRKPFRIRSIRGAGYMWVP